MRGAAALLALGLLPACWAADKADKSIPAAPGGGAKMEAQMRKLQKEQDESLRRQMEEIKRADPKAYAELERAQGRRKRIDDVLARLRSGVLAQERAKKDLFPLVKAETAYELSTLDKRIQRLEKELAELRRFQKDPDALVRLRVEELTGERVPEGVLPLP